ncbi:MAG: polyprenyl synthetase family protein [Nitratireductor sp.]
MPAIVENKFQKAFQATLAKNAENVATELEKQLSDKLLKNEIARPQTLINAMQHGALNGGKRIRPFLVLETSKLFGITNKSALRTATALECVHCYSLIHDDLPAMDDDDLRRGQPTVHKKFNEAAAILAGDSLLTLAFDILADPKTHKDANIRSELVLQLARASGVGGMAGGQMLDLEAEETSIDASAIKIMQSMKTGALLRYACEAGAILGGATKAEQLALKKYGQYIGQAFQLADDILDVTSNEAQMGKKVSKDQEAGKGTLVNLYGVDAAQEAANKLTMQAIKIIEPFGSKAQTLIQCAQFIVSRTN